MKPSIISKLLLGLVFYLVACKNNEEQKIKPLTNPVDFVNRLLDSTITTKNISLDDLIHQYDQLGGQTIQTEGVVYFEFENFAICTEKEGSNNCFWLRLNRDLPVNDSLLQLVSGQNVIIKGTLDNSDKGHLSSYLGTISNVYYLKTK